MNKKLKRTSLIMAGITLLVYAQALATETPCPGCQTRVHGTCVDNDSKCQHYCYGGKCVECEDDNNQCDYCEYCSSQKCKLMSVNDIIPDPSSGIFCPGSTAMFYANIFPVSYGSRLTWDHEGAADSGSVGSSSWAEWTTPGNYTVTTGCGEASKSIDIMVVGVESVEASDKAVCYPEHIVFTANPTPPGPLNGLRWWCRYRAGTDDEWSSGSSFYGDGDNTLELCPAAWNGPGFYEVCAKNGLNDDWCDPVEVKVVQVNIEPQPHSPLSAGQICTNAQEEYRRAPWKATVKPAGTKATVSCAGPVSVSPTTVEDEEIFYVESVDEEAVGSYTATIVHNDCGDCPYPQNPEAYDVFKFIQVGPVYDSNAGSNAVNGTISGNYAYANLGNGFGLHKCAYLQLNYKNRVETAPANKYSGEVKTLVEYALSSTGTIEIDKKSEPSDPMETTVTFDWKIISCELSGGSSGTEPYGWALAGTNAQMCFNDVKTPSDELVDQATIKKDHKDVSTSDEFFTPYYCKFWQNIQIDILAIEEFSLETYTDYPSWVGIAVESQNDDLEDCKIPYNSRSVEDMEVEFKRYIITND